MGRATFARPPREAEHQCIARDANEAIERSHIAPPLREARRTLRCECGDAQSVLDGHLLLPSAAKLAPSDGSSSRTPPAGSLGGASSHLHETQRATAIAATEPDARSGNRRQA